MAKIEISCNKELKETDPLENPVIIIGKLQNLLDLNYERVQRKFGENVSKRVSWAGLEWLMLYVQ